jgi:hypothetical protein
LPENQGILKRVPRKIPLEIAGYGDCEKNFLSSWCVDALLPGIAPINEKYRRYDGNDQSVGF